MNSVRLLACRRAARSMVMLTNGEVLLGVLGVRRARVRREIAHRRRFDEHCGHGRSELEWHERERHERGRCELRRHERGRRS
jgi:hypothetical protein